MLNGRKTRIAVMVSGGGTNLQALIDAQGRGEIPSGEIALVLSNRSDAFALERARRAGIAADCAVRKACGSQERFEAELLRMLSAHNIDMIVLAGFLAILSADFTSKFAGRIINIHPSLIPSFCGEGFYGLRVHEAALGRGVKITGATVHYVNEIPDGGEIILQKPVEVLPGDTPGVLQLRVMQQAEWIILPLATEIVANKLMNERV